MWRKTWLATASESKREHLVEIAVVEVALRVNGQGGTAHQAIHGLRVERLDQCLHVLLDLVRFQWIGEKPVDWHVRDRERARSTSILHRPRLV